MDFISLHVQIKIFTDYSTCFLQSIANVMKDASLLTRWGLNVIIRQTDSRPLVHMTAKEFMFGYESSLVTLGNNLMPAWIKFDRLGLIDRVSWQ